MSRAWMPLYVSDYLADTSHLTAAESGAYLHLIMHYWSNGALPDDDRRLARIARMSDKEWKAARDTIADFFKPGWRHDRIERHLSEAEASYNRRAEAGRKGGNAKSNIKQCSGIATAGPKQSEPEPYSERDKSLSERDLGEVQKIKSEIAGIYAPGDPPDMGRIDVWLAQGYPPDIIRGVVLEICRRHKPAALKYCDNPLEDAAAKRAPPMPPSIAAEDVPVFIDQDDEAIFARARELYPQATPKQTKRGRGIFVPPAIARQARQGAAA